MYFASVRLLFAQIGASDDVIARGGASKCARVIQSHEKLIYKDRKTPFLSKEDIRRCCVPEHRLVVSCGSDVCWLTSTAARGPAPHVPVMGFLWGARAAQGVHPCYTQCMNDALANNQHRRASLQRQPQWKNHSRGARNITPVWHNRGQPIPQITLWSDPRSSTANRACQRMHSRQARESKNQDMWKQSGTFPAIKANRRLGQDRGWRRPAAFISVVSRPSS